MTFSIVIATHGHESWKELALSRAFPSAVNQGAEVLIAHDTNLTRAAVRNRLLREASGDFIITLDADDELAPGYVDAMKEAIPLRNERLTHVFGPNLGDPIQAFVFDASRPVLLTPIVQYVRNGKPEEPKFWKEVDLKDGNWMVVGTAAPRELMLEVGGWREFVTDGVLNEWDDWDMWIRCVQAGAEIVKVPDAVYVAHVRNSPHHSRSRATTNHWLKEIRQANGIGG